MAPSSGQNRPGQNRYGQYRPGRGSGQKPGQGAPVFKEITWLRRWPRLVATCFVLLILLEIVIFAWVAEHIGLGLTLLALIGSAAAGLWLIHHTGLEMVGRLRLALAQGQEPGHSLVDGACFVIAGMFLILPGFFTDLLALVLILPVSRNWVIRRFAKSFGTPMAAGGMAGSTIITDVEFREVHADEAEPGAAASTGEATGGTVPAGEAQQPKAEPQIFIPAKAERASGAAVRADVIDIEIEAEPEADTAKGTENAVPGDTTPKDTAPENTAPETGAGGEDAAETAKRSEQPVGKTEDKKTGANLGAAPRRPVIDVEED